MISFSCFYANAVHAELNKKEAKRLISKVAGMSLPSSAVRIESINSTGESTAEVSTELELVFRLARDDSGQWQVKELRTADARWENIELILHAAKIDLQEDKCGTKDALGRVKPESGLNVKRARCLIASLFDVPMPSDSVRIQEISDLETSQMSNREPLRCANAFRFSSHSGDFRSRSGFIGACGKFGSCRLSVRQGCSWMASKRVPFRQSLMD